MLELSVKCDTCGAYCDSEYINIKAELCYTDGTILIADRELQVCLDCFENIFQNEVEFIEEEYGEEEVY